MRLMLASGIPSGKLRLNSARGVLFSVVSAESTRAIARAARLRLQIYYVDFATTELPSIAAERGDAGVASVGIV